MEVLYHIKPYFPIEIINSIAAPATSEVEGLRHAVALGHWRGT